MNKFTSSDAMLSTDFGNSKIHQNDERTFTPNRKKAGRTIIDITHFVQFMVKANHVSGIQRVIQAVIQESERFDEVVFSTFTGKKFLQIAPSKNTHIADVIQNYIAWKKSIRISRKKIHH